MLLGYFLKKVIVIATATSKVVIKGVVKVVVTTTATSVYWSWIVRTTTPVALETILIATLVTAVVTIVKKSKHSVFSFVLRLHYIICFKCVK